MRGDLDTLLEIIENREMKIELHDINFIKPVFILSVLCLHFNSGLNIVCNSQREDVDNYLNRLNFYGILGIPYKTIRKYSSTRFIEITPINYDLTDSKIEEFRDKILLNMGIKPIKRDEAKAYSINFFLAELVRNVTNHANLQGINEKAYFMFQAYPITGIINISIVDSGIGIKESFKHSSHWKENKDTRYYIDLAFERGKTSNANIGAGNGLYFCKELIKITDSRLSFISGNTRYDILGNVEKYTQIHGDWQGVIIDLELNIHTIDIKKVLSLFNGVYPGYIKEYEELNELFI